MYAEIYQAEYLYRKPHAMQRKTHQQQSLFQGGPSWCRQYQVEE